MRHVLVASDVLADVGNAIASELPKRALGAQTGVEGHGNGQPPISALPFTNDARPAVDWTHEDGHEVRAPVADSEAGHELVVGANGKHDDTLDAGHQRAEVDTKREWESEHNQLGGENHNAISLHLVPRDVDELGQSKLGRALCIICYDLSRPVKPRYRLGGIDVGRVTLWRKHDHFVPVVGVNGPYCGVGSGHVSVEIHVEGRADLVAMCRIASGHWNALYSMFSG